MKGHLTKSEDGWYVIHHTNESTNTWYPVHPDEPIFVDKRWENEEIDFELVTEWGTGEVGVNGITYAKMLPKLWQPDESKNKTAVEYLISMVKSPEWQDMYIWHKEEVFKTALAMEREQKKEDGKKSI